MCHDHLIGIQKYLFYHINPLPAAKIPGAGDSIEHSHVIPPPSTCSDCSTSSHDSGVHDQSSDDSDSLVDESELGEFLMDTFQGLEGLDMEISPVSV